jgi:DNA polymerase II
MSSGCKSKSTADPATLTGWLFDVYEHSEDGIIVWIFGEDSQRYCLRQSLPVKFHAFGTAAQLRSLWKYLRNQEIAVELARVSRRDLFSGVLDVMEIAIPNPAQASSAFRKWRHAFPHITWYDTDIPLSLRFAAEHHVFPMAKVQVTINKKGWIRKIVSLDSPWDLEPVLPPLRVLNIRPDTDPFRTKPQYLFIQINHKIIKIAVYPLRQFVIHINAILRHHDPDLIISQYGDTWLFPLLMNYCQENEVEFFNPNRDTDCQVLQREARSFFTYGQTIYRGQQTYLFGRWHIDECNAMMYGDYGLAGVLEQARVTGLPIQEVARKSPGAGIPALQIVKALQMGILVPYQKQQAEQFKSARQLMAGDRGGLVAQPVVGLHDNVAEIDFVSMYPSIMVNFNISPETVNTHSENTQLIPELDIPIDLTQEGFVPQTLQPLIEKRVQLKNYIKSLNPRDCRSTVIKARTQALKWLLVVCFGYLGYKNARFGRIESHMAVTAYGRECLLRAKEAAEDLGYRVLYLYIDGLWVQKDGLSEGGIQPLLGEILERTGLPIALEGIYRWIAFLPSRIDARVPVANRYFGTFTDGSVKMRGIETRRRDTPPWIVQIQTEILADLARLPDISWINALLPSLIQNITKHLDDLTQQHVPVENLVITQTLSRELDAYAVPSPVARAAAQLRSAGKEIRPGQRVRFIYTRGKPDVAAWDLPDLPNQEIVNTERYRILLLRAVHTVLQPFGLSESTLQNWLLAKAGYGASVGTIPAHNKLVLFGGSSCPFDDHGAEH